MSIIKNFGFMWQRDKVNWGSKGPGKKASLMGQQVGNLKRHVDFASQMGIYVLYDRFEAPVQVGQSERIFARLKQHQRDHLRNRWAYFTWFGFYQVGAGYTPELLVKDAAKKLKRVVNLAESLNEIEAVLIQVLEPRLNRRGANWDGAEEYLQISYQNDSEDDDVDVEE
jgi:hypothetical protein